MITFAEHLGTWHGTNDFRLLPTDPFHTAPADATVTTAAGGNLVTIAYSWSHPEDSTQDGLLVVGQGENEGDVIAFWADSWHQYPSPRVLLGSVEEGVITLEYEYESGWFWRIYVDMTDEVLLQIRMDNVVPDGGEESDLRGAVYSAMLASFTHEPAS